jgi:hypothetical protein
LKCVLCRKGGSGTSSGIRPILLDLQGFPRDDEIQDQSPSAAVIDLEARIDTLLGHLQCLSQMVRRKKGFSTIKSSSTSSHEGGVEFNATLVKGCTETFNLHLLKCHLMDWFAMVERQHVLQRENEDLPDLIRQAEMTMSIAGAPDKSLTMVKQRLDEMYSDRQLRLEVLKELLEDLCLREMNLFVSITGPDPRQSLSLKPTSAAGFLGVALQRAGETLPVG